jgi:protein involved in polysaccharide export with SLBB domain
LAVNLTYIRGENDFQGRYDVTTPIRRELEKAVAAVLAAVFFCITAAPPVLAADKAPAAATPAAKETPKNAKADGEEYPPFLIGPGDVLVVAVYGEAELPIEYQVDSDGVITYPYAGKVRLGGLTPAEASDKLARLLNKPRKVTVLVKESNTYWVSIFGHVGKPGKYQIKGKPTLLSALAEAGGPLPGANLGGAILIHKNMKSRINLKEYLKGTGQVRPEPYLYPGDVLNVPKSGWPKIGEMAIVASILASAAVLVVQLDELKRR